MSKIFLSAQYTGDNPRLVTSLGLVSENDLTFSAIIDDTLWHNSKEGVKNIICSGTVDYVKDLLTDWLSQFETKNYFVDSDNTDWDFLQPVFENDINPVSIREMFVTRYLDPNTPRQAFVADELDLVKSDLQSGPKYTHDNLWYARVTKECYFKLKKIK